MRCVSRRANHERSGSNEVLFAPGRDKHCMEPATRIERATCGLRITTSPTSDKLTPQETTNQDSPDMGEDGGSLSCPGSSVVADIGRDNPEMTPLIKSSDQDLPQDTQENQDKQFQSVSEHET